jgi:hypothetical protein
LRGLVDLVQRVCNASGESDVMQVTSPFDCGCDFAQAAPAHHARLLLLEREPFAIIGELIETAATWAHVSFHRVCVHSNSHK